MCLLQLYTATPTTSPANVGDSRMWYIPVLSGQPGSTNDLRCDNSTQDRGSDAEGQSVSTH